MNDKGINSEPVSITAAIQLVLSSGLVVYSLFVSPLDETQQAALILFGNSVIFLGGMLFARARVTSIARPSLLEGTRVEVITPEGQPNTTTTL